MEQPQPPTTPTPDKGTDGDLLQTGEHILTEVRRHPIGIIVIYLEALLAIIAIVAVGVFSAQALQDNLSDEARKLVYVGVLLVILLVSVIFFVAVYIYRQSKMLVTDRSLVQILQRGLFNRKVSRLSMSNVEDVSADQRGILPTMFNYGTLTVQTAGEEDNFIFPWCPRPNAYAERILEARQAYAQSVRSGGEV